MSEARRVLLIDDMFTIRTYLKGLLRKHGLGVLEATDGREGLELARREKPDLIITDVKMPQMTGIEICRAVRADAQLASTPIIVLTGEKDEAGTRTLALDAGASAYLRKPINADALEEALGRLLS